MRIERVVVNASPLICLCKSGLSEILPELFADIVVPARVYQEITIKEDITRACRQLFSQQEVKVISAIVIPSSVMSWDLGEGESSVLAYALNHPECWVVIDDLEARKCAATLGCRYTGTVGIILLAKRRGLISSAKDCLTKIQNAGLWLSQDFVREICLKAGEQ
ncbi:MAG: DUF3368 domain-containing protein [Nitrospirota bacterium]